MRLETAAGVGLVLPTIFVTFVAPGGTKPPCDTATVNGKVWHREAGEGNDAFRSRVASASAAHGHWRGDQVRLASTDGPWLLGRVLFRVTENTSRPAKRSFKRENHVSNVAKLRHRQARSALPEASRLRRARHARAASAAWARLPLYRRRPVGAYGPSASLGGRFRLEASVRVLRSCDATAGRHPTNT